MVLSRSGKGFVHLFSEIDEDDLDPVITPAGKFWVEVVQGSGQFQLAPIKFASSGYATSLETAFIEAVGVGEQLEQFQNGELAASPSPFKIYGRPSYGGGSELVNLTLVESDGVTAFVPDGVKVEARLRAELVSSDSGYSPFVSGGALAFQRLVVDTLDESVEVTSSVLEGVLSVPDDGEGVAFDMRLVDPEGLETVVPALIGASNRPVLIGAGSEVLLDGFGEPASVELGTQGESTTALYVVRDAWKVLEGSVFVERVVLDGMTFGEALRLLVERSGVETLEISDVDFRIPYSAGARSGEWGLMIEPGDTAADWLRRLMETFASGWIWGFRPGEFGSVFYAISPLDMSMVPKAVLYGERYLAEANGGSVFWKYRQVTLEPEANEVRVTGVDPGSKRPLQAMKSDYAAQDSSLLVENRPANWVGEIRQFGLVDPGLSQIESVEFVCRGLFDELSRSRVLAEFESSMLVDEFGKPLWRGDIVELVGIGLGRIRSFGCWFGREEDSVAWREAVYAVELI